MRKQNPAPHFKIRDVKFVVVPFWEEFSLESFADKFKNDRKINAYVPELEKDENYVPKDRTYFFNVKNI